MKQGLTLAIFGTNGGESWDIWYIFLHAKVLPFVGAVAVERRELDLKSGRI